MSNLKTRAGPIEIIPKKKFIEKKKSKAGLPVMTKGAKVINFQLSNDINKDISNKR